MAAVRRLAAPVKKLHHGDADFHLLDIKRRQAQLVPDFHHNTPVQDAVQQVAASPQQDDDLMRRVRQARVNLGLDVNKRL